MGNNMADKKIKMVVMRDFWPVADQRVRTGTIVEVEVDAAMDGMEKGLLARVKDTPNANS
jgi:hypothetical protein